MSLFVCCRAERMGHCSELYAHGMSVPVDGVAIGNGCTGIGRHEMRLALPLITIGGGQFDFGSFLDEDTQTFAPRGVILNSEGNCHKLFRY